MKMELNWNENVVYLPKKKTPCDFEFSKTVIEELLKPRRISDIGGSTSQRLKLVGRKSLAKSIRYTLSK